MADAGQQAGDRRRRRDRRGRERLGDCGLVVDSAGAIVPSVGFELLADSDEFIDDLATVSPGGLFRSSRPGMQRRG